MFEATACNCGSKQNFCFYWTRLQKGRGRFCAGYRIAVQVYSSLLSAMRRLCRKGVYSRIQDRNIFWRCFTKKFFSLFSVWFRNWGRRSYVPRTRNWVSADWKKLQGADRFLSSFLEGSFPKFYWIIKQKLWTNIHPKSQQFRWG